MEDQNNNGGALDPQNDSGLVAPVVPAMPPAGTDPAVNDTTPKAAQPPAPAVDPNPARTASDTTEEQFDKEDKARQDAEKASFEAAAKVTKANQKKAAQDAAASADLQANEKFAALPDNSALALQLMNKLGVDELFENSNGEYFTKIDLAIHSEKGNEGRVKTHTR